MHRIYLAFLCFFRVLFGKPLPAELMLPAAPAATPVPALPAAKLAAVTTPAVTPPKPAAEPSVGALQMLGLLQREGRLVDFLCESIDSYDDASIGVAVRDIHRGCRKVLDEHFDLEPVMPGAENDAVVVDKSDPTHVRLVGNVSGQPPFRGTLRHHGWRATRVKLPTIAEGIDQSVLAPAEVEL